MENTNDVTRRHFTVWRFESATTGEVVIVARVSEVDDLQHAHAYQRVLWQGWATSKPAALSAAVGTFSKRQAVALGFNLTTTAVQQ